MAQLQAGNKRKKPENLFTEKNLVYMKENKLEFLFPVHLNPEKNGKNTEKYQIKSWRILLTSKIIISSSLKQVDLFLPT